MNALKRLVREPNLILGLVTAGLSLLVLFGVDITEEQMAGIGVFLGALVFLVRFMVTPSAEVVVQEKPSGELVAGPAAVETTGVPVRVSVAEVPKGTY
jgi:Mn2+/Fe2+ NRAMP family transporter